LIGLSRDVDVVVDGDGDGDESPAKLGQHRNDRSQ
jgi:hypothetical protein